MFLFQYATIVKAAIDAGTCASISSETTCDTSAISYYETFEYNGNRVIISSGSPSHDAENGEMYITGGQLNPNRRCNGKIYVFLHFPDLITIF